MVEASVGRQNDGSGVLDLGSLGSGSMRYRKVSWFKFERSGPSKMGFGAVSKTCGRDVNLGKTYAVSISWAPNADIADVYQGTKGEDRRSHKEAVRQRRNIHRRLIHLCFRDVGIRHYL